MSEKESEMLAPFPSNQYAAASVSSPKSVAQTEAAAHNVALWRRQKSKRGKFDETREAERKNEPAAEPPVPLPGASNRDGRLEVQLEVKHIVNSIPLVNQTNVIADHDVAVSRRRGAKANEQIMRDRPKASAHFRRKNKSLVNVRLPFAVPIAALFHSESVVVMLIPIVRTLAIVVVESIVIVMIDIMMVTVVISMIVIMMVAIIMILSVSERYA